MYRYFVRLAIYTFEKFLWIRKSLIYRKVLGKYKKLFLEKEANEYTNQFFIKSIAYLYITIAVLLVIIVVFAPKTEATNYKIKLNGSEVVKSDFLEGKKTGYIEAEVVIGNYKENGIYKLQIPEKPPSDEQIIKRIENLITEKVVAGENKDLNKITTNLNLPMNNAYGAKIIWKSNSPYIDIQTGKIIRKPKGEGNIDAIITVDMSKNLARSTKVFNIIILEDDKTKEQQQIEKIYRSLDEKIKDINKDSGSENYIILPDKLDNANIKWNEYIPKQNVKDDRLGILITGIMLIFYICYKRYTDIDIVIKRRKQDIEIEFCVYLNKIILLIDAGLNIRAAMDKIINNYKERNYLYIELSKLRSDISSGMYEYDAYNNFAKRCGSIYINKFVSILIQGLKKGNEGLKDSLKDILTESFENRKNIARKRGEEASTKLIIPLVIIFIAIMIIIIYPAIVAIRM